MGKKIRVWDGSAWQDVAPSLPYTAIHSAQASMPSTAVDGQVWLDTDGTLADTGFVPLTGGTMTGNLNTPSINSGPIVGRNKILNGDFGIWQRGTSFSSSGYTSDRWKWAGGTGTISRQQFTLGSAPVAGYEGQYYLNWTLTGNSQNYELQQNIEDVRSLAGLVVTLSFWARSTTGAQAQNAAVYQYFGTGGSPSSLVNAGITSYTPTSTWQRFSFTYTMPSIEGKTLGTNNDHYVWVRIAQMTTTATNTSLDIWGVQLEVGNQATPFHNATPNKQTELAACQRYYYNVNFQDVTRGTYNTVGAGFASTSSNAYVTVTFPINMRIAPGSVTYTGPLVIDDGALAYTVSNVTLNQSGANTTLLNVASTGMTQYRPVIVYTNGNSNARLSFSAEL